MSKKSKIVVIGYTLIVFLILMLAVVIPRIDDIFDPKYLIGLVLVIITSLTMLSISFESLFIFIEFFISEKTILRGRTITGIFSLLTILLIFLAPSEDSLMIYPALYRIYFIINSIIIVITIVLMSTFVCFFMMKKGFDKSSITFYILMGVFFNSYILSLLSHRYLHEGDLFWTDIFIGLVSTIISLIVNWKEIKNLKSDEKIKNEKVKR